MIHMIHKCVYIHTHEREKRFSLHFPEVCSRHTHCSVTGGHILSYKQPWQRCSCPVNPPQSLALGTSPVWSPIQLPQPTPAHFSVPKPRLGSACLFFTQGPLRVTPGGTELGPVACAYLCSPPFIDSGPGRASQTTSQSTSLSLGSIDIWGLVILCWGSGVPGHCRVLSSIPGLYPLDAGSTHTLPLPSLVTTKKCLQMQLNIFRRGGGQSHPLLSSRVLETSPPVRFPSLVWLLARHSLCPVARGIWLAEGAAFLRRHLHFPWTKSLPGDRSISDQNV